MDTCTFSIYILCQMYKKSSCEYGIFFFNFFWIILYKQYIYCARCTRNLKNVLSLILINDYLDTRIHSSVHQSSYLLQRKCFVQTRILFGNIPLHSSNIGTTSYKSSNTLNSKLKILTYYHFALKILLYTLYNSLLNFLSTFTLKQHTWTRSQVWHW